MSTKISFLIFLGEHLNRYAPIIHIYLLICQTETFLPLIIYYFFKALGYYCSQIGFLLEYLQQHLNVKVISLPINGSRSLFMGNLLLLQNNQWIWIIDFKIKHFFKSLGSVLYCWNVFVIKYWLLIIVGSYSNMVRFIYSLKMCVC